MKITIFNGKIHYKWPFSIATLNYQRVYSFDKWCIYIYILCLMEFLLTTSVDIYNCTKCVRKRSCLSLQKTVGVRRPKTLCQLFLVIVGSLGWHMHASTGVGKCPNWTSPNYWGYKFQQIFEGDIQNPQKGTFTNPWSSCKNRRVTTVTGVTGRGSDSELRTPQGQPKATNSGKIPAKQETNVQNWSCSPKWAIKNTHIPSHYTSWLIGFPTMGCHNPQ